MPLANRMEPEPPRTTSRRPRAALWPALAMLAITAPGCLSTGTGPFKLWSLGRDNSLSPAPSTKETGDDRNFMARWMAPKKPPAGNFDADPLILGSDGWRPMKAVKDPAAEKEFQAALELFQQNKLSEAEAAFKALAKNRKGTPYGEKGQYYLAETQYQRGNFTGSHDSFDLLIKDYPGTEYNDKLVKREYEIAQLWLANYDPKAPAEKKQPWYTAVTGKRPLFDPHGHALAALEHVRQHNPTGPLADDAVLRIADEHMNSMDYETAAIYYDQLIADHPKSPFLQRAQLSSIDARMKAYLGPEYDGSGLEKARELVKQTMTAFPDRADGNEKLYHILDIINDQEAERAYKVGEYYKKTGKVASAEYYFGKIPQKWPKSTWAEQAKTQLASLAKMPREISEPSKIMTLPGSTSGMGGGMGGMGGGMGGMGGGMGGMGGGMGGMGGMN